MYQYPYTVSDQIIMGHVCV